MRHVLLLHELLYGRKPRLIQPTANKTLQSQNTEKVIHLQTKKINQAKQKQLHNKHSGL